MVDSLKQYPHLLNPQKQQIDKTYLTIKNKIQESGLNSVKPWTNSNQETSDENIFVKNRNTNTNTDSYRSEKNLLTLVDTVDEEDNIIEKTGKIILIK